MNKDSVLELKQQVLDSLVVEGERRRAGEMESLVDPRIEGRLAVGFSQQKGGEYQLELRVQSGKGKAYRKAEEFKERAKNEANIEITPRVEIPTKKSILEAIAADKRRLCQSVRPLHIGLSIGHTNGSAGTLGAFVSDDDDNECILSNNHVLALMGQGKLRDPIFQPGRPDQSPLMARHTIAELSDFPMIAMSERNEVDSAVAVLVKGIDHDSNKIPSGFGYPMQGRMIKQVSTDEMLGLMKKDEPVCKIGRTTEFTEGVIGAIALDNVPVKTPVGNVVFDNVIQINWGSDGKPFTKPGDSGSLVFMKKGLVAVGLHFASGIRRVDGKEVGVSYSCSISAVLKTHGISLLD